MNRPSVLLLAAAAAAAVFALPAGAATAATATRTVVTAGTATVGLPVTVTAKVKPAPTTGTVRFTVGGQVADGCSAVVVSSGKATCSVTFGSEQPVTVTAVYGGGGGSASSTGTVTVTPADGTKGQLVGGVGGCTKKTGTLVAVSYGAWDGPIVRGCDTTPTTGIDLLRTAGFTTAGTAHDGPAFLCRIGHPFFDGGTQYPTPATEACQATPPASAYWSYWLAAKGTNTWTYAGLGAYSQPASNGEVQAWTFGPTDIAGTTGQPAFTPNQVRAGLPKS